MRVARTVFPMILKHTVRPLVAVVACGITGWALAGCATPRPYNPYSLAGDPLTRVSELCQNVMGLNPAKGLEPGYWPGNPDPAYWTNPYRNCVASLSQSLKLAAAADRTARADATCREQGFASNTPEHATCVLQTSEGFRTREPFVIGKGLTAHPDAAPTAMNISRKQEWVCSQLGLEPSGNVFASCVSGLHATLEAENMDSNYTN